MSFCLTVLPIAMLLEEINIKNEATRRSRSGKTTHFHHDLKTYQENHEKLNISE